MNSPLSCDQLLYSVRDIYTCIVYVYIVASVTILLQVYTGQLRFYLYLFYDLLHLFSVCKCAAEMGATERENPYTQLVNGILFPERRALHSKQMSLT